MKKILIVLAILILSSGCFDIPSRGEKEELNQKEIEELFNKTLEAQGLGSFEALTIDKKIIDIDSRGILTMQQIDKKETLEGSSGCKNFKITREFKGEVLKDFKIETSQVENCFIRRD